ncbi:WD40-repeat-containing domain protein [Pyronema omphalodes]|nr:WD40-repeat-containing domain protein [Pyronema omphalodes]
MADSDTTDYEAQRQANIARNKALLQQLQLDNLSASLTSSVKLSKAAASSSSSTKSRKPSAAKRKRSPVEASLPRRTSSRLAGLPADSTIAKEKAEEAAAAREAEIEAKRQRVAGDLSFEIKRGLFSGVIGREKYEPTFTKEDVEATGDKGLKEVREKIMGLTIWDKFEVNDIKITPERIYAMEFHPTVEKRLIFAVDKIGTLGIFNAGLTSEDETSTLKTEIKEEAEAEDEASSTNQKRSTRSRSTKIKPEPQDSEDEESESESQTPDISQYKIHTRTISSLHIPPFDISTILTASYDSSIRSFSLTTGKSTELLVLPSNSAFSSLCTLSPSTLLFSTLEGQIGRYDTRQKTPDIWQCSEKKIGGCHALPGDGNFLATASLDRSVKIWDLRNMDTPVAEHGSRLSISSAMWSNTGRLATTSYDDTVKIYHPHLPSSPPSTSEAQEIPELQPQIIIPHNNQTGRWITILRAIWQSNPQDQVQKLVVANMNRGIDVYDETGRQLAQLHGDGVTAVPAVARFHERRNWIVGGTASGKVVLFV